MTNVQAVAVASPPWVDLFISALPSGTASIMVERSWGNEPDRVRGDSTTPIIGGAARLVDWAAPVGVGTIVYRVTALSATGQELESEIASVASTDIGHSEAWLSDPHDPTGAVLVGVLRPDDSGQQWSAPGADAVATITGLPLALDGRRMWRTRQWTLVTESEADALLVEAALDSAVVLLRAQPECLDHRTGVVHVMSPSITRTRTMPHEPRIVWELAGPETRGPQGPPAVAARTYQDDLDEHPTYAASLAALPTYIDRLRG